MAPTQRTLGFWGTNGAVTGDTSELIGIGAANTTKVVSTFPSDNPTNNAANYADQYINSGKSDWNQKLLVKRRNGIYFDIPGLRTNIPSLAKA